MTKLEAQFAPAFKRDIKRLDKKHIDDTPLKEVINLIIENSDEALLVLKQRHNMHTLTGNWSGSNECHVCNAGNWLLVWCEFDGIALMQRTGTHDEIFR
jgi:mRNA interferase YafQ